MGATLTRSDFLVNVRIPGVAGVLEFETMTGGQTERTTNQRARAGAAYRTSGRSGPGSISDITVGRQWDPDRDSALAEFLRVREGRIEGCEVARIELAADKRPAAGRKPKRWASCTLKQVTEPEPDSDSDELAMLQLVFSVQEPPK